MVSLLIVLSIFVAVAVGYKTKINVGLIAIAFSYIFGSFILGMKPSAIIGMWPNSLFFFIMMASFFYGIAVTFFWAISWLLGGIWLLTKLNENGIINI